MRKEFVLISFKKPEERKTLNINISGYVNNIIIEFIILRLIEHSQTRLLRHRSDYARTFYYEITRQFYYQCCHFSPSYCKMIKPL